VKLLLDRELNGLPYRAYKFVLRKLVKQVHPYHPVAMDGKLLATGERNCNDRWQILQSVLAEGADSLLDLGCAEGYFVSRAARDLNVISRNEYAGFMYAHMNMEFLRKLPQFDVVVFLAVLHHVMYEHGVDHARELMSGIRMKTRKVLVFEMGQSNEKSNAWASQLPDMGSEPQQWIRDFLLSCGFSSAEKVGETDAYQSSTRRSIFLARP
jgi:hypothetical protein